MGVLKEDFVGLLSKEGLVVILPEEGHFGHLVGELVGVLFMGDLWMSYW